MEEWSETCRVKLERLWASIMDHRRDIGWGQCKDCGWRVLLGKLYCLIKPPISYLQVLCLTLSLKPNLTKDNSVMMRLNSQWKWENWREMDDDNDEVLWLNRILLSLHCHYDVGWPWVIIREPTVVVSYLIHVICSIISEVGKGICRWAVTL